MHLTIVTKCTSGRKGLEKTVHSTATVDINQCILGEPIQKIAHMVASGGEGGGSKRVWDVLVYDSSPCWTHKKNQLKIGIKI